MDKHTKTQDTERVGDTPPVGTESGVGGECKPLPSCGATIIFEKVYNRKMTLGLFSSGGNYRRDLELLNETHALPCPTVPDPFRLGRGTLSFRPIAG